MGQTVQAAENRAGRAGHRVRRLLRNSGRALRRRTGAWLPKLVYPARVLLAMAAGAVVLPGSIAPFGLALCIAVPQEMAFLCCAGTVLGSFAALPMALAVRQAAGALAIGLVRLLLGEKARVWAALLGVTVCSFLSQTAHLLGQSQAGPFSWIVQGLLVMGLAILYARLRPEVWLVRTPEEQLLFLACWAGICCGFALLPLPGQGVLRLWLYALLGLAGLTAAAVQRPGLYIVLSAGGALAVLLSGGRAELFLCQLAVLSLAGAAAPRRAEMAGLYAALGLLVLFAVPEPLAFLTVLIVHALTALVFALLPDRLFFRLEDAAARGQKAALQSPARTLQALAGGLEAVAGGVETVSRSLAPAAEGPDAPVEAVCRQVCSACTLKARCWGAEYDDTRHTLQTFLTQWRSECSAAFPPHFGCIRQSAVRTALLRAENLRVLRQVSRVDSGVLRQTVSSQYRAMAQGLSQLASAWQPETVQPQLESRVAALAGELQLPLREICAVRLADGTPQVRLTLREIRLGEGAAERLAACVSRCCGCAMTCRADRAAGRLELVFSPRPAYTLCVGSASHAYGTVCGDTAEMPAVGDVQYVILCDGMGTGRSAAEDSRMTALFTARLLRAGFEGDVAARLVNAALLAHAPGDRGSTLDLLRFSAMDGEAVFYKTGACAAWLVRSGTVRRLGPPGEQGLPLGSAGSVKEVRFAVQLAAGDRLVMVTDGVLPEGGARLEQVLAGTLPARPAQAAGKILQAGAGQSPQDDATVVVADVCRK